VTSYQKDKDRVNAYRREWRLKNRDKRNAQTTRYRRKHPEKTRAHWAVNNAIRSGRLIAEDCFCGAKGEAHHEDYEKPLDVKWLCKLHHKWTHTTKGIVE
jgi:hypothetical protein